MRAETNISTAIKLYRFVTARAAGDPDALDEILYNVAVLWSQHRRLSAKDRDALTDVLIRVARLQRTAQPPIKAWVEAPRPFLQ